MYADTIEGFAKVAEKKLAALRQSPGGFLVSSMLAGAYVGMGIILILVLCNWLVCLAIWMSARVNSDSAKCIVIFWCLLAFIASGFEHSVANMTLLGLSLVGNHPATVSVGGFGWNLLWVTLGNIVGGAVFVAGAYQVSTHGFPVPAAPGEKALRPVTAEAVVEPLRW